MRHEELDYEKISPSQDKIKKLKSKTIPFMEKITSSEGKYITDWTYSVNHGNNVEHDGKFISFVSEDYEEPELNYGWKIHVGINDTNIENLSLGWNIVKEILISHNVHYAKVIAPNYWLSFATSDETVTGLAENTLSKVLPTQKNKQITIYCFMSPHIKAKEWKQIIGEITIKLAVHKIEPAPFCGFGERAVPGSHYVT